MKRVTESSLNDSGAIVKRSLYGDVEYVFNESALDNFIKSIIDYHSDLTKMYTKDSEDQNLISRLKHLSLEFRAALL